MKIAYIKDAVYPWKIGGAQKRVWEIANRLANNFDVHIYGMKYWEGADRIQRKGVTLHGVCEPREFHVNGRRSIKQALWFTTNLTRPLLAGEFDIIDCQKSSYFPFFPSKAHELINSSTLVGTFNEVWDDYWYEYLGRAGIIGKSVERVSLRLPEHVITISEQNREQIESLGRDGSRIHVIPDGIDLDHLRHVSGSDERFDVLYAGRLIGHKNVELLVQAIHQLNSEGREVSCGIIGDGEEYENLSTLITELGEDDNIELLGFLEDSDDVYAYMTSSNVFVLPSLREGAGLVTLEANACGTPSITVDHPNNAAREVVEDGVNGYLCENSIDSLAETISITLEQAPEMKQSSIDFASSYDWDEIAKTTAGVYKEATGLRAKASSVK